MAANKRGKKTTKSASKTATTRPTKPESVNGIAIHDNGVQPSSVSADQIRVRAYHLFLARGGTHGDDQADWFAAERELLEES